MAAAAASAAGVNGSINGGENNGGISIAHGSGAGETVWQRMKISRINEITCVLSAAAILKRLVPNMAWQAAGYGLPQYVKRDLPCILISNKRVYISYIVCSNNVYRRNIDKWKEKYGWRTS